MKRIIRFFQESYAELRKVMWPSTEEVISSTKVVLISTLLIAGILGFFDFALKVLMDFIF
ncbi:MAG: preprotein translocase subunit SecE [Spirochaetales bacterium]|nr:preprotein translocase subunit SecE [Spirochaetales bacterium]